MRAKVRHFSDMNENMILLWQALQSGWKPPTNISEEEYEKLKRLTKPSALRGFAGTACAFGGLWFTTYARDPKDKTKNFAASGSRQFQRRIHALRGAVFTHRDYRAAMDAVNADVIYLDPPYAGTSEYEGVDPFDSDLFWDEVRRRSDGTRRIIVSEYKAPSDFTTVLTTYSRMGLRTKSAEGLTLALREENLYEYDPPKGRRMVSFASLYED